MQIGSARTARALAVLAIALLVTGCVPQQEGPGQSDTQPGPSRVESLSASDIEAAKEVLERYLTAYAAGDLQAVLDTVPEANHEVYRSNLQQMARHKGYRFTSITPREIDDPRVVEARGYYLKPSLGYEDYEELVIFRVVGEFPDSTPDDVLLEEHDAYMVRTSDGDWLYLTGGP